MEQLPIASSGCPLDDGALAAQRARYRLAGRGAEVLRRDRSSISLVVSDAVGDPVIEELVAVERSCCPFFKLQWLASARRLTVSVADAQHEPALAALVRALGASPSQ